MRNIALNDIQTRHYYSIITLQYAHLLNDPYILIILFLIS
jgi:hypothetical protein